MDELTAVMLEILQGCRERGFVPPWILCCVSPSGSVTIMRFNDGETDLLAEHLEGEGFRLPMTVFVVDQRNETANIAIEVSGQKIWN